MLNVVPDAVEEQLDELVTVALLAWGGETGQYTLHPLLHQYHSRTGSRQAEWILKNWTEVRRGRKLRKVLPLAVARKMEDFAAVGTNAG